MQALLMLTALERERRSRRIGIGVVRVSLNAESAEQGGCARRTESILPPDTREGIPSILQKLGLRRGAELGVQVSCWELPLSIAVRNAGLSDLPVVPSFLGSEMGLAQCTHPGPICAERDLQPLDPVQVDKLREVHIG